MEKEEEVVVQMVRGSGAESLSLKGRVKNEEEVNETISFRVMAWTDLDD